MLTLGLTGRDLRGRLGAGVGCGVGAVARVGTLTAMGSECFASPDLAEQFVEADGLLWWVGASRLRFSRARRAVCLCIASISFLDRGLILGGAFSFGAEARLEVCLGSSSRSLRMSRSTAACFLGLLALGLVTADREFWGHECRHGVVVFVLVTALNVERR